MGTLIKNGIIVTDSNQYAGDVYMQGGKIAEIGQNLIKEDAEIIDATGKYILPGGIDQHVHFSFNFNGAKVRGFESSASAAVGGTTTVIEFVNQIKGKGLIDSIEDYRKEAADGIAAVDYSFHIVLTDPREEVFEEIGKLGEAGYPTMKLFMAYKGMFFHSDDDAILKALLAAKEAGVTVMVHAENADAIDVLQKQLVEQGEIGPYSHVLSRPPMVEAEATRRAIYLAQMAEAPIYIVHVSCKEAAEEISKAYIQGTPVLGETCTHYLTLDDKNLAKENFEGAKYVCSPALRPKEHFDHLWNALMRETLNAVSSDHCGFDWKEQKHMGIEDFRNIPNGAPGLQNRLEVLWSIGVATGKISPSKLVEIFSTTPAKNTGLDHCKGTIAVGYDGDIVIYDENHRSKITNEDSLHGVDYCPYEGMEKVGKVDKVFLRGKLVVEEGKYIGKKGDGNLIKRKPFGLMYRL